jgi:hypothetical protein
MTRLVLKGQEILARSGEPNAHRLSLKVKVSYPTIEKYINRPELVQAYDAAVLGALFTDGLGLTAEAVSEMPLSAFFEVRES